MALNGNRLKTLRERNSLTQEELADRAQVNLRLLQKYEKGEVDPSIDVASRLATVLSTTVDYLAGLTNDSSPRTYEEELGEEERKLILALRQRRADEAIQHFAALSKPG